MRFSVPVLTALSLYISQASAVASLGFNLGVENNDGTCKTASDYEADLDVLKDYTSTIKVYSAANCDTLEVFGPVAEKYGFKIALTIAATGTYDEEKAALQSYLPSISKDTIQFVSVGSESLYRGDISASDLASEISEIKDLLGDINDSNGDSYSSIPVGTDDSWEILVDGANAAVVEASDVLYANAFSYWQGQTMKNSSYSFFDDIMQALQTIQTTKGSTDIEFWVGETGWPSDGTNFESSEPGVANAKTFWQQAVCGIRAWGINTFVFEAFDEDWKPDTSGTSDVEKHWGVWDSSRTLKYSLDCSYD